MQTRRSPDGARVVSQSPWRLRLPSSAAAARVVTNHDVTVRCTEILKNPDITNGGVPARYRPLHAQREDRGQGQGNRLPQAGWEQSPDPACRRRAERDDNVPDHDRPQHRSRAMVGDLGVQGLPGAPRQGAAGGRQLLRDAGDVRHEGNDLEMRGGLVGADCQGRGARAGSETRTRGRRDAARAAKVARRASRPSCSAGSLSCCHFTAAIVGCWSAAPSQSNWFVSGSMRLTPGARARGVTTATRLG